MRKFFSLLILCFLVSCKAELQYTNIFSVSWVWPVTNGYTLNNVKFQLIDNNTQKIVKEFRFITNGAMDGIIVNYDTTNKLYSLAANVVGIQPKSYKFFMVAVDLDYGINWNC
jgi:hypothetical protein